MWSSPSPLCSLFYCFRSLGSLGTDLKGFFKTTQPTDHRLTVQPTTDHWTLTKQPSSTCTNYQPIYHQSMRNLRITNFSDLHFKETTSLKHKPKKKTNDLSPYYVPSVPLGFLFHAWGDFNYEFPSCFFKESFSEIANSKNQYNRLTNYWIKITNRYY